MRWSNGINGMDRDETEMENKIKVFFLTFIIGALGRDREPGVGKLSWNFNMGFERNSKPRARVSSNFLKNFLRLFKDKVQR